MEPSLDEYLGLARRKIEVARRHLIELEAALPHAEVSDPASANDSRAAVEGHADGTVIQAYAAFDTFACAAARHFGSAQPDRASLNGLLTLPSSPRPPAVIADIAGTVEAVRAVTESGAWKRLSFYRNLAVHRGVVAQRTHFSLQDGFSLRIGNLDGPDPDHAEVLPILGEIMAWAEATLPPLLTLGETWQRADGEPP